MPDEVSTWTEPAVAAALADAEAQRHDLRRFTATWTDLDVEAAYRIQAAGIEARVRRGRRRVGVKLGLTSLAKQRQMNVAAPLTGILTDEMAIDDNGPVRTAELIHPRIEPEIAFVMGADLTGPRLTADDARAAVSRVHAAIEIIDSRYRDFDFRLPDVVADNASSARFVMDPAGVAPDSVDVVAERVELLIEDRLLAAATGAAVMGDPYLALALAANDLASRGDGIRAGEVVLSGALTDAHPIRPGETAIARFGTLGTIRLTAI